MSDSPSPVLSVVHGNNADLIAHIAPLYVPDGALVRDVTWGKGAFWKKTGTSGRFTVRGSDIADHIGGHGEVIQADFCDLPDADESADLVVLDPPYVHTPGKHMTNARYNNAATTTGMYHRDIRELYRRGMTEAWRVTKYGGQVWVKGKDEVESGVQCWSHAELREDAEALGFYARDMFLLVPDNRTAMNRWNTQKHARKVHSFLWVFDKQIPKKTRPAKVEHVNENATVPPTSFTVAPFSDDTQLEALKEIVSDVLSDILVRSWDKATAAVANRVRTEPLPASVEPRAKAKAKAKAKRAKPKPASVSETQRTTDNTPEKLRELLRSSKERSGLTWDQIGSVFGVKGHTAWVWAHNGSPSAKHVPDVLAFAEKVQATADSLAEPSPNAVRDIILATLTSSPPLRTGIPAELRSL